MNYLRRRVRAELVAASVGLAFAACASDPGTPPAGPDCDLVDNQVEDVGGAGMIYTWAGTGIAGYEGGNRPLQESEFFQPVDLIFTGAGETYILDWNNHTVRRVTAQSTLETVIGYDQFPGDGPDDQHPDLDDRDEWVDGTLVLLNHPTELNELPNGNLLMAAWHNHKLREFNPSTGEVHVTCGDAPGFEGDGQSRENASIRQPSQAELGPDGHVYILDQVNLRLRRIRDYMTDPEGIIETVAGTGTRGFAGDGGDPLQAEFAFDDDGGNPQISGAMTFGPDGHLYIADTLNHRIRRIDFGLNRIDTIAGSGVGLPGQTLVDGPADQAKFYRPLDIEFGPDGRLYIADELNHAVRALDLTTMMVSTVAGRGTNDTGTSCILPTSVDIGDGGPATEATLNQPRGLAFDADGRLYIVDTFHSRIRVLTL